ncbi:hypothetical protein BgiMline_021349, partial [Biomphalaria glabrata]
NVSIKMNPRELSSNYAWNRTGCLGSENHIDECSSPSQNRGYYYCFGSGANCEPQEQGNSTQ